MKIDTNKFISLSYDLNINSDSDDAELVDQATAESPLEFIFGTGSMLEGFEKNLEGLKAGDSFDFKLEAEDAYGEFNEEAIVDLPKDLFLQDGVINEEIIFVGNTVPMMDSNGYRLNGTILEVNDDTIKMDFNHPLAGEPLHFTGKVIEVRDATPEELTELFAAESGEGCGSGCSCSSGGGCGSGCGC